MQGLEPEVLSEWGGFPEESLSRLRRFSRSRIESFTW
jgi:hypothetical protein